MQHSHNILCIDGQNPAIFRRAPLVTFSLSLPSYTNHSVPTVYTVFTLIKRKIQFTQGNSKNLIAVILNNAHRIFRRVRCRNFTHACISYGNVYPISARNSLFRNFYDSNTAQARFVFIFFACVLFE